MKVGSLFSGIGGFELGFRNSGHPYEIAWQVEIDPYCRKVLARHFPDTERFEDIREVGAHNLAPIDVLCGGFPCQDISLAGLGAGLAGARSGLWFEMLRVIEELRPRYIVAENVRALTKRGLPVVIEGLRQAGYSSDWCILSAEDCGAPHRRSRVWIVATRIGEPVRFAPQLTLADAQRFSRDVWPRGSDPEPWERGVARALAKGESAAYRRSRLHAIGNAIVPQIAELIARQLVDPAHPLDRVSLNGVYPLQWPTALAHDAADDTSPSRLNRDSIELPMAVLLGPRFPTPTAAACGTNCGIGQELRMGLASMARAAQWPTAKATDDRTGPYPSEFRRDTPCLAAIVHMREGWPAPTAHDCKDRGNSTTSAIVRRAAAGKQIDLSMTVPGQLNPDWVELLMGYPSGWTSAD